jgi:uncharacterized membrane protein
MITMIKRFWEIDFLRGIAILLMIFYHFLFDLYYFANYNINVQSGVFLFVGRSSAVLFLILVGVSLTLSYSKSKLKKDEINYKKYFLRGLKIFGWGLVITLITWILFPNSFIIFGILHLIGVSIILSLLFLKLNNKLNLILGVCLIFLGLYLMNFSFDFNWLLWLGFIPKYFNSFDYFPILPWFGFVLIGLFLGNKLYKNSKRQFNFIKDPNNKVIDVFNYLGKHSLFIYFIHQPIIFLILYFFSIISF